MSLVFLAGHGEVGLTLWKSEELPNSDRPDEEHLHCPAIPQAN
ncbi:MAG: hypothetical protein AAFY11_13250 [Cyanobacteria bacterium J06641_5]